MQPCGLHCSTDHGPSLSPSIASHHILQGTDRAKYYFVHLRQLTTLRVRCYRSLCSIPIIITVRLRGRPGSRGSIGSGRTRGGRRSRAGRMPAVSIDKAGHYEMAMVAFGGWHCCVPSSVLDQEHGTAARARTRRIPRPKNVAPHSLPPRSKQARQTLGEPDAGRREKSGVGPRRTAYCVVLCCQKTKEYSVDKSIRNPGCLRQQSNALHATWFPPPARLGGNGRSLCLWRRIKTSGTPVTFLQLCGRPFSACSTNQKPPLQGHQVYSGLQVFLVSATAGSITAVTGAAKENSD